MRALLQSIALTIALLVLAASAASAQSPLSVYTVNYPLAYFAQRIGGTSVKVSFPAPRDVDPAFWNPDAATVQAFQKADLILLNGAGYARWVARVSLPRRKLVDTSRAFRNSYLRVTEALTHSHGSSGQHAHTGVAFVTWLDFTQAIEQARAVDEALTRVRPGEKARFAANFTKLEKELKALDAELEAAFAPLADQPLLASHPIYQYLARSYRLNLASVTWEPNETPAAAEWQRLEKDLKSRPARWMLWEGMPRDETVARLKALGVGVIVFDPSPNVPASGNFMGVMRQNVVNVKAAVAP